MERIGSMGFEQKSWAKCEEYNSCQGNESINNFKELGFYHKDFCVTEM